MRRAALSALLSAAAISLAGPTFAAEDAVGPITISDPWARATAPTAPAGAAYMTLSTAGEDSDRLIMATSPAATLVELHTVQLDGSGVMRMREVEAIDISPDAPTSLAPGGFHIMLIGLTEPLVQGEEFPLTLTFEGAGSVEISVPIASAGASSPPAETD